MKKVFAMFLLLSWVALALSSCDTQKPANDLQDAKDRVKTKIETEREKQKEENPDRQEESN